MNDKVKAEIFDWIKTIVIAVALGFIITCFIKPTIVNGVSMDPTLKNKDYLIINRLNKTPKDGQILVFKTNLEDDNGDKKDLIKRVIATSGQHLVIKDNKVYVDDKLLNESYIHGRDTEGDVDIVIPEGKLFAMGDNRTNSNDSRSQTVGLVSKDDILGTVIVRLYPFNKIGTVK